MGATDFNVTVEDATTPIVLVSLLPSVLVVDPTTLAVVVLLFFRVSAVDFTNPVVDAKVGSSIT